MKTLLIENIYTVGQEMRKKRAELGLSIEDVSRELGFTARSVYHWERGDRFPTVEAIVCWAEALGYDAVTFKGFGYIKRRKEILHEAVD